MSDVRLRKQLAEPRAGVTDRRMNHVAIRHRLRGGADVVSSAPASARYVLGREWESRQGATDAKRGGDERTPNPLAALAPWRLSLLLPPEYLPRIPCSPRLDADLLPLIQCPRRLARWL